MNDFIKSCRRQCIPVLNLSGEEEDGGFRSISTRCLQHAKGNLAGQRLPVSLALARDDEVAFPYPFREMDGIQDGLDAGMHFRAQVERERGADATCCAGARQAVRVDSVLCFPGFCLTAEPPFQFGDARPVSPFLRAENSGCSGRTRERDIHVIEGVDPEAVRKGSERLEKTGATVHDRCPAKADPYFFYSL